MASKKYQAFADMSADELRDELSGARARLQRMKFNHVITPAENPNEMRLLRRDIARIQTAINAQRDAQ